jgi:ribonuclease T2
MWGHRVRRAVQAAAIAFSFTFMFAVVVLAQERGGAKGGEFDFYVLALSWSPSYCASVKERAPSRRPEQQCAGRPYAFIVHGLWPQYERGYPSHCRAPVDRLDADLVSGVLDLMPSPRLVLHQWNRHGTCTGLSAQAYFDTLRKARAAVTIPAAYHDFNKPTLVAPRDVAEAFVKANPGLTQAAMAVACDKTRLTEVRLCLRKDFTFRDCAQVARRNCRRDELVMPAVRGG